jgi:hypothetical protein
MLFYCIILVEKLRYQLSILLALDLELISLLLDLDYLLPFSIQHLLHLLHGSLELGLLLLALLEFPLDPVDQLLLRSHLLEFLIPLHAVLLERLHSLPVVG